MLISEATDIVGSLSNPQKMPGLGYGIPAKACNVGGKLQPIIGSVCNKCYALKGRYVFPNVQASQYRRLSSINDTRWTRAMVRLLKGRQRWFRWHDSGDLQGMTHLIKIVAIALLCPTTKFWIPTREYALIKAYRDGGGVFPRNLAIRLSAPMVGAQFPTQAGLSSMVLAKGTQAPKGVFTCPASKQQGLCGDCRACWSTNNTTTAYPIH